MRMIVSGHNLCNTARYTKKMAYMTWRAKRANRQPEITWDPFTAAEVFASSHLPVPQPSLQKEAKVAYSPNLTWPDLT